MADAPRQVVNHGPTVMSWPIDADGNPMTIVCGSVQELVPTAPFGNVTLGPVTIMQPVPMQPCESIPTDADREARINAARAVQRDVEYVVGTERRKLANALDPGLDLIHPVHGEVFAAPPPGYDQSSMLAHPADVVKSS